MLIVGSLEPWGSHCKCFGWSALEGSYELVTLVGCRRALWEACRQLAASTGGAATFTRGTVASLGDLERSLGPLTGVVVAAGAAVGTIPETSAIPGPCCACWLMKRG